MFQVNKKVPVKKQELPLIFLKNIIFSLLAECCKNDLVTCSKVSFASCTQNGVKLGLICAQFILPSLIESLKKSTVL